MTDFHVFARLCSLLEQEPLQRRLEMFNKQKVTFHDPEMVLDWLTDARQPYERTHGRTANSLLRWLAYQANDNPDTILADFKESGDLRAIVQGYIPSRKPSAAPCEAIESYFSMTHPAHCEMFAHILYHDLSPEEAGWAAVLCYNRMPETVLVMSRHEIKRMRGDAEAFHSETRPDKHEVVCYACKVFVDDNDKPQSIELKCIDEDVPSEDSWISMGRTTGALQRHLPLKENYRLKRHLRGSRPYYVLNPVRVRVGVKKIYENRFQRPALDRPHIIEWGVTDTVFSIADLAALIE